MTSAQSSRQKLGRKLINASAVLGLLYLFAPIVVIVLFSFNEPKGKYNIVWQGFTLDNWANPFSKPEFTDALIVSLQVAAVSTVCATLLGTLIAIALSRYRFKGSGAVNLFLVLPMTSPEIVLGSSLATLFLARGVERGFTTVVIAHIMFQVSFVAVTLRARIRGFDWALEQAAMDLGASPRRAFWKVTFPLILPGIVAASLLSFALSIDDFIITFFNAGSLVTFPLQVFGASRVAIPPQLNVLASMLLFGSIAIMVGGLIIESRRQRAASGSARH
ncbi:MAG: ABC transporter permease [Acidimicrobiaceae bacterium]|jgi:spermidine/putrescine transport system permease protein|nr:ABC transporter permease [Ilumatobacteraceae bacterium]